MRGRDERAFVVKPGVDEGAVPQPVRADPGHLWFRDGPKFDAIVNLEAEATQGRKTRNRPQEEVITVDAKAVSLA